MKLLFHCFLYLLLFCYSSCLYSDNNDLASRFIALAIQGDLVAAHSLFEDLDPESAEAADLALAGHFNERFVERTEATTPGSGDARLDAAVSAYRSYWADVLTGARKVTDAEALLDEQLKNIVQNSYDGSISSDPSDPPELSEWLESQLESQGYHVLEDRAPPFRDLIVWRKETDVTYRVRLTDRSYDVPVVFMDDFVSMGWKHYAALGLASTTGWVEDGRLYCVTWAYDRGSENFRVSYLKHEARHLADLEKYPALDSTELEYRAKLTELAFAYQSMGRLLNDFTDKSAENPESPHALANFRVTRDVYAEIHGEAFPAEGDAWEYVNGDKVNRAARELLERHTLGLEGE